MIAASLLLMTTSQLAAATDDEIVVTARRLSEVRVSYGFRRNRLRSCTIVQTSGDPLIDRVVCETALDCAAGEKTDGQRIQACMGARRDDILETVAAQRAAAQTGRSNASN